MHIDELHIQNFRCFQEINLKFSPENIAVIVGINGAGKSSLLDGIATLLMKLVNHLTEIQLDEWIERGSKISRIDDDDDLFIKIDDILYGQKQAILDIKISDINYGAISWNAIKKQKKGIELKADQIMDYMDYLEEQLQLNPEFNLPVLVYYRTHNMMLHSASIYPEDDDNQYEMKQRKYEINQLNAYRGYFNPQIDNFQDFFIWFRVEEDYENEIRLRQDNNYRNPNLEVIRKAIEKFLEGFPNTHFSNLRVVRTQSQRNIDFTSNRNPLSLTITKNDLDFKLEQLSDGEKTLLMLVTDLARRLAIANPGLGVDALQGEGIVLIDEIDLHLHPQWQRIVIPSFTSTFPNCHFIVTTHSPQVLSNVKRENVFILEDYQLVEVTPHTYGQDSNSILYELMNVNERPQEVQEKINACFNLIDEEELEAAKVKLQELADLLGEQDSEIIRAKTLINFLTE